MSRSASSVSTSELIRPALNLSKRSYLDLLIREFFKGRVKEDQKEIHSIANSHKNPKQVLGWVADVEEIHKRRVPPSVFYSKKMPEIDTLMQAWDPDFEAALGKVRLGESSVPMSTEALARVACSLFDIPVHETTDNKNLVQSLHVLFTLYASFCANDHFQTSNSSVQGFSTMQRIEFN